MTVKVTVPSLTAVVDEIVAVSVTFCAPAAKGAFAFATVVIVPSAVTVSVPPVLVLVAKAGLLAAGL